MMTDMKMPTLRNRSTLKNWSISSIKTCAWLTFDGIIQNDVIKTFLFYKLKDNFETSFFELQNYFSHVLY